MGVVLEALARWRYTATSHGSWAESERLTRDMRLAGWLCVAWMCVRESVTVSTIRAVSVLVCLTKCVLAPQLHRAPVCVYACVCTVPVHQNVRALRRYRLPISKRQAGA